MKAAQAKRLKILNECNERIHTIIIDKEAGGEQVRKNWNSNKFWIDLLGKLI